MVRRDRLIFQFRNYFIKMKRKIVIAISPNIHLSQTNIRQTSVRMPKQIERSMMGFIPNSASIMVQVKPVAIETNAPSIANFDKSLIGVGIMITFNQELMTIQAGKDVI